MGGERMTADQNYVPDSDEVARLLMARTRDRYGNLAGVFNDETEPTDTQVDQIILDVITDVADAIGDTMPDALIDDAQHVVAIRAAMQIELSYYPEQISNNRSPYPELKTHYDEDITRLAKQVEQIGEDGDVIVVSTEPSLTAVGFFPDPEKYPPYGLATRW